MDAKTFKAARHDLGPLLTRPHGPPKSRLTQAEFAAMLGAAKRTVQDWESGARGIPNTVAKAVARLGHDLDRHHLDDDLIIGEGAQTRETYVVRLRRPGLIAIARQTGPIGNPLDLRVVAWLDPPPDDPAELPRLMRDLSGAVNDYFEDLDDD